MNRKNHHPMQGALAGMAPWTPSDDATLARTWALGGYKAACAALPGRSPAAIYHRRRRIGLDCRRRRWTKMDDARLRDLWLEGIRLPDIAKALSRTETTAYYRSRQLGLTPGCPDGFEYLSHAAERTGYCTTQLRPILRWAGVVIHCALARPTPNQRRRRFHFVEPVDVDEAIENWLKTEPAEAAARRLGLCGETLRRKLKEAGLDKRTRFRQHLRVTSEQLKQIGVGQ